MKRNICLSIAGFDPSSGAGISADLKVFEKLKVYGLGVCTNITVQDDKELYEIEPVSPSVVKMQLEKLLKRFCPRYFKIGLITDLQLLQELIEMIRNESNSSVVLWDPVLKSSSGYYVHEKMGEVVDCVNKVDYLTPNWEEMLKMDSESSAVTIAKKFAEETAIILKGGHSMETKSKDYFFSKEQSFVVGNKERLALDKHGSGCVFSAAFLAFLAKGYSEHKSLLRTKRYINGFLRSDKGLLGYHCL